MVKPIYVDINCDLGEGLNNESDLMPFLSSCNIACGGHAGDTGSMSEVLRLAKRYGVKVGAHPSYPDKENFGRIVIGISEESLIESLRSQILELKVLAEAQNVRLNHIKPHGALYNVAAKEASLAKLVVEVLKSIDPNLILYAPYNSEIAREAIKNNVKVFYEGFADRNYNDDLSLVNRNYSDAIIHEKREIFDHVFRMLSEEKVRSKNGVEVGLKIDTICFHGDHKNVVENLKYLRANLAAQNIKII